MNIESSQHSDLLVLETETKSMVTSGDQPPLFPNLRELTATQAQFEEFPHLRGSLLKPALQHFHVQLTKWGEETTILKDFTSLCPKLTLLDTRGFPVTPTMFDSDIFPALMQMSQLTTLTMSVREDTIGYILSNIHDFPSIHTLEFTVIDDGQTIPPPPYDPPKSHNHGPTYLTRLWIISRSGDSLLNMLEICRERSIQVDDVGGITYSGSSSSLVSAVLARASKTWPDITQLSYMDKDRGYKRQYNRSTLEPCIITPSLLIHLLTLRSLTSLDLQPFGPFILDPTFLDRLAASCPLLKHCVFSTDKRFPHIKTGEPQWGLRFTDALRFAGKLPHLRILGIASDARRPPTPSATDKQTQEIAVCPTLEELHIGVSSIDDVSYVEDLMRRSVPNLITLWWQYSANLNMRTELRMSEGERDIWQEVERNLGLLVY
ncbi:hypothetical protein FRC16_006056 [Serendipita sp. 398]|nr:hypothetical protein FRC16_006056 [Serendipita sp. 398]